MRSRRPFSGVESLLNSRSFTTVSDDPNDNLGLTLSHFLIGQMGATLYLNVSATHLSTQGSLDGKSKSLGDLFANSGCKSTWHILEKDQSALSLQITFKWERLLSSTLHVLLLPDGNGKYSALSRCILVLMDLTEWWIYESRTRS